VTATIVNHLGATLTGEIKCWMGRRVVEIETPDGTRHIGTLHPVSQPMTAARRRVSTIDGEL
jgi:hypothetical protein